MKTTAAVASAASFTLVLGSCDSEGRYSEERITFTPDSSRKTVQVEVSSNGKTYRTSVYLDHARTVWAQWVAKGARRVLAGRAYSVLPGGRLGYGVVTSWYSDAGSAEECCPPGYEYESHITSWEEDLSDDETIVDYTFRPVVAAKAA